MAHQLHDALDLSLKKPQENSYQATCSNTVDQLNEPLDSGSPTYPSGIKLAFIFVALCLTVFLVALVCYYMIALTAMTVQARPVG